MNKLLDTFIKHDCPWCIAAINTNMFEYGPPLAIELKRVGDIIIGTEIINIYCCPTCRNKYEIINNKPHRIIRLSDALLYWGSNEKII